MIYLFCLHSGPDAADLADSQNTVRLCLFFVCMCVDVLLFMHKSTSVNIFVFVHVYVSQLSCSVEIDSSWFAMLNAPFTPLNSFRGASFKNDLFFL